jgi:hypothetical protein
LAKSLHACIKANEKQLLARLPVTERRRVIDLLRRIWTEG